MSVLSRFSLDTTGPWKRHERKIAKLIEQIAGSQNTRIKTKKHKTIKKKVFLFFFDGSSVFCLLIFFLVRFCSSSVSAFAVSFCFSCLLYCFVIFFLTCWIGHNEKVHSEGISDNEHNCNGAECGDGLLDENGEPVRCSLQPHHLQTKTKLLGALVGDSRLN